MGAGRTLPTPRLSHGLCFTSLDQLPLLKKKSLLGTQGMAQGTGQGPSPKAPHSTPAWHAPNLHHRVGLVALSIWYS